MTKNYSKRLFSLLLAILIVFTAIPSTWAISESEVPEGLEYETERYGIYGEVTITGYSGNATKLTIPDTIEGYTVTTINGDVFADCTELESITIGKYVDYIGGNVFSGCTNLSEIILPDNIKQIDGSQFTDTAYYNNENNWENDVLYIGTVLIEAKDTLSGSYTIKDGTTSIASSAFDECTELESITMPNTVISIGAMAFYYCQNLTSIKISENLTNMGYDPFLATPLSDYDIEEKVYYLGKSVLNARWEDHLSIREGTELISQFAFQENTVSTITLPDSIKYINRFAFRNSKIINITIPGSVKKIERSAFLNCTKLESVTLSNGTTTIDGFVFYQCDNLKKLTIPESVTKISDSMFGYDFSEPPKDLTIYGFTNSAAETFAKEKGIKFESIGISTITTVPETESTTTSLITRPTTDPIESNTTPTVLPGTFPNTSPSASIVITTPDSKPVVTVPDSTPVITESDSAPIVIKPTTAPDSKPVDTPIFPSDELVAGAVMSEESTGYINFNWPAVEGAVDYDFTLYDYNGNELFTHEISTNIYVWNPEDTVMGYFAVASKDTNGNILSESSIYSFIIIANDIQLAGDYGDVDENFKVNIKDATAIQKYLANMIELSDFATKLADVNADEKVNIKDATTIQKHCANLKPKSRIGEMLNDHYIVDEIYIEKQESSDPTESCVVEPSFPAPITTTPDVTIPDNSTEATEATTEVTTETAETTIEDINVTTVASEATTEATEPSDSTKPAEELLSVNLGESAYTAKIGETITYNLMLETGNPLNTVDGCIHYDSTKLKIVNEYYEMCPNLETKDKDPIVNVDNEDIVYFNTSSVSYPIYFNERKPLITIEFEAIDSGEANISHEIKFLGMFYTDEFYFDDGKPVVTDGISVAPVIESVDSISIISDNKTYTAKTGDTITYYLELQADELFENISGSVFYDSTKLRLIKKSAAAYCPLLSKQIEDMYDLGTNDSLENELYFFAVEITDGFDFTEKRTLVMLEFEALETGTTSIDYEIDNMTIFYSDNYYFNNHKTGITEGITLTASVE